MGGSQVTKRKGLPLCGTPSKSGKSLDALVVVVVDSEVLVGDGWYLSKQHVPGGYW